MRRHNFKAHQLLKPVDPPFHRANGRARLCNVKKTVFVLSTDYWLNSLHGSSILSLFRALTKLGYRVKVLLPSIKKKNIEVELFSVNSLDVRRHIPLVTLLSLYGRALKLVFEEKNPIVIFDPPMLPLFLLAMVFRKSKGIMLILSRPLIERGFFGWLNLLNFRLWLILGKNFVEGFTAISPFEAAEFSRLGKIPENKITVIPSPLGEKFEKFNFFGNRNELRLKLGLRASARKKVLLYQGVLDKRRGILEFLELFHETFKGNYGIVLLLIGDGPAADSIKNFITNSGATNIFLLGPFPYSKMPEAIMACDVGLVLLPDKPLWRYQCPTKLVEFLALGKPVIASDLPGIRWIARKSSQVFYIKEMTSSGFKEALQKLLFRDESITAESMQFRKEIIHKFSSFSVAQMLSQMICSL